MFVFDTSVFINGSRHHYFLETMRPVWNLVEEAIEDGRVLIPREVYREVVEQDDSISALVKRHRDAVVDPSEQVQARVGTFEKEFGTSPLRDRADPFVIAEAEARRFVVVTYEGVTFAGTPARGADRKLPAISARYGIGTRTFAQALRELGLRL